MESTFYNWYVNKIDAKGRVSVPAAFRGQIDTKTFNGIAAFPSFKFPMVEGSGIERTDWMRRQLETLPEFSDEYDAMQELFSETVPIPFDGEGRIVLPQPLLAHANLTDSVLFAGAGNVFQMWEPNAYETYKTTMRDRRRAAGSIFAPRRSAPGETA